MYARAIKLDFLEHSERLELKKGNENPPNESYVSYRLKISHERTTSFRAMYGKENKGKPLISVIEKL